MNGISYQTKVAYHDIELWKMTTIYQTVVVHYDNKLSKWQQVIQL